MRSSGMRVNRSMLSVPCPIMSHPLKVKNAESFSRMTWLRSSRPIPASRRAATFFPPSPPEPPPAPPGLTPSPGRSVGRSKRGRSIRGKGLGPAIAPCAGAQRRQGRKTFPELPTLKKTRATARPKKCRVAPGVSWAFFLLARPGARFSYTAVISFFCLSPPGKPYPLS